MEYCFVKFEKNSITSLKRLKDFFDLIKIEKDSVTGVNEEKLASFLSEDEKDYFWNPTEEEKIEWADVWSATPVDFRLSPKMPLPPWDLYSMLDAFWHGDYDLTSIEESGDDNFLKFNPHGFPYGGVDSMVALIESFGHKVIGIDDGTGYVEYLKSNNKWKSGMKYPFS